MLMTLVMMLPLALAGARVIRMRRLTAMMHVAVMMVRARSMTRLARLFCQDMPQHTAGGGPAKRGQRVTLR